MFFRHFPLLNIEFTVFMLTAFVTRENYIPVCSFRLFALLNFLSKEHLSYTSVQSCLHDKHRFVSHIHGWMINMSLCFDKGKADLFYEDSYRKQRILNKTEYW